MTDLTIGCIIDTPEYGNVVCVSFTDNYVQYRYFAERVADRAPIWVLHGCNRADVTWVSVGNDISRHVAQLQGPYGEGLDPEPIYQ